MTHSLAVMIQEAAKVVEALTSLLNEARELDLHYIPFRYPNGLPSGIPHQFYGRDTAERAVAAAQKIVTAIETYYRDSGEEQLLRRE